MIYALRRWYTKSATWIKKYCRKCILFCSIFWCRGRDLVSSLRRKADVWFQLCYAPRSSAALTVHRTVLHYRSPSSPPTHAQNNKRAIAYATTLSLFWQGQKDLNPRPMVLEWLKMPEKPWKCSLFRMFQPLFLARPCVEVMSENYWCFFDALWISAVLPFAVILMLF